MNFRKGRSFYSSHQQLIFCACQGNKFLLWCKKGINQEWSSCRSNIDSICGPLGDWRNKAACFTPKQYCVFVCFVTKASLIRFDAWTNAKGKNVHFPKMHLVIKTLWNYSASTHSASEKLPFLYDADFSVLISASQKKGNKLAEQFFSKSILWIYALHDLASSACEQVDHAFARKVKLISSCRKETLLSSKFNILVVELSCSVFFSFFFIFLWFLSFVGGNLQHHHSSEMKLVCLIKQNLSPVLSSLDVHFLNDKSLSF